MRTIVNTHFLNFPTGVILRSAPHPPPPGNFGYVSAWNMSSPFFPSITERDVWQNVIRLWVILKAMYSFGKEWTLKKKSVIGFVVYRVLWILKALWIVLSATINILKKKKATTTTKSGFPQRFCHWFMYIAPSSGHSMMNQNFPFKLILRRFEVVFWCLGWEYRTVYRLMKIHSNPPVQYYLRESFFFFRMKIRHVWNIPKQSPAYCRGCPTTLSYFHKIVREGGYE